VHEAPLVELVVGGLDLALVELEEDILCQGTRSHTMVPPSSLTASRVHSGDTPFSMTALLPTMKLPNQCILAPV
jgi:hypothetical protein